MITDGLSGFIVDNMDDAVRATQQAGTLNRAACRAEFMKRFSAPVMAQQYVKLYQSIIAAKSGASETVPAARDSEIDTLLTL